MTYEMPPYRPPSEAGSVLIRATRNCPWNKCAFCPMYKGEKFGRREVDDILADIDKAHEVYGDEARRAFIGDADIPEWISVLKQLPDFGAETVVPGHGRLCGEEAMAALCDYLHGTWARTVDHLAQGHTADEAAADPDFPRYAEGAAERYHETNIRLMYAKLTGDGACPI